MVVADKVIVELQAKLDRYHADVMKAQTNFERAMGRIQRSALVAERRVQSSAANMAASLTRAFAVAGGVRGLQMLFDTATRIDNALKVAGLSGAQLEKVYSRLQESARRNAAPLETLVTLYGRAALVQKELNVSQEEMLNFTDKVAMALRVAGTDAQSASGALLQLSQALGSGIVRAEEFNSILEGALPIAQAAAAGLKEAGGSVARLRQLVVDGKVSSEAFFRAFEAGSVLLEQKVAGATLTTSQGFTILTNALIDATREFLKGSMSAESLGNAFQIMADTINGVDFEAFGARVRELMGWVDQLKDALSWVKGFGAAFGEGTGLDKIGEWITGGAVQRQLGSISITSTRALQARIDGAFAETVETAGQVTEDVLKAWAARNITGGVAGGKTGRLPSTAVSPISLSDYALPNDARKGKGSREDAFQRDVRQIRERTMLLQAETAAQAQLNPLLSDYEFAVTKARAAEELLNAAKQAKLKITPELEAQINELATAYANATVEANKLAESQEEALRSAEEWLGVGRDVTQGFIGDLLNGKSAAESFANAISKIGDALINDVLNNIFKINNAGSGGVLSSILGLFGGGFRANTTAGAFFGAGTGIPQFASGTNFAPGGVAIVGERGPELINLPRGSQVIPNHRLRGDSPSNVNFNMSVMVSGTGDKELMERMQKGVEIQMNEALRSYDREVLPARVNQIANDPHAVG